MAGQTQATAIAALEAKRNEELTLAAGALAGERRAALARTAMMIMFATCTEIIPRLQGHPHRFSPARALVGTTYMLFAVATLLIVRRVQPNPRHARVRPLAVMLCDFSFLTFMGLSDQWVGMGFRPELAAAAGSVVITFSIARVTVWHVVASVACAIVAFAIIAGHAGHLGDSSTYFVIAGYVALGVLIGLTNHAVSRMFRDLRRRDNLTRFLPRPVAERVIRGGTEALAPVQREVTVLFSDIRGFTALSEHLPPRDVLVLLDDYFGRMSQIVKGHDGVVGKFLGDGLLAFWGVPDRDPDHAIKAVRAAADMLRALTELNRAREADGAPPLRIGIGVHTGAVAAGMLGGAEHAEYTVIGDAVNVASRVEGLTKERDTAVLVSESTWALCGERVRGRRLEPATIRGRLAPVGLYALADPGADAP